MEYSYYKQVRNATWQLLIDYDVSELPVSVSTICRKAGIKLFSYRQQPTLLREFGLAHEIKNHCGIALLWQGTWIIFYDASMPIARIRFTVAHELGHIALGHLLRYHNGISLFHARTNIGDLNPRPRHPDEQAADVFAARLLAPACVLWGLDLHTADRIAATCNISKQAALYRAARMSLLYQRNKFLLSPLEKRLYHQFLPYINNTKR